MRGRVVVSLRALASPVGVLSLVVLILNDHILKEAWPGLVTGKLSDVAGLVVAPLLLAVGLALVGLRRPAEWACAATALGFALVKSLPAAAVQVSSWWSVSGFPTAMRPDPWDLLTLPAVGVALAVHRHAARRPAPDPRRAIATAVGIGLLPIAVVATAATSCLPSDGVERVWVARGDWAGPPDGPERRLVVQGDHGRAVLDPAGALAAVGGADSARLDAPAYPSATACDRDGACWRVGSGTAPVVERSADLGQTWSVEYRMSEQEMTSALDGVEPGCGDAASARLADLAVLPNGPYVAVAASHAGALLRSPKGDWTLVTLDELEELEPSPSGPTSPPAGLVPVPPSVPPDPAESPADGPDPPDPPCPSPSLREVTPNPSNGPPTVLEICP